MASLVVNTFPHCGSSASLVAVCWEKLLPLLPWCSVSFHRCPWFLFVHLALEISSEEEVLRLGTLVPMNIEVPTKYPSSQDRIIVFEIRLHSKSPMLFRLVLYGNWNALSLARRALKDKFPTPMVPLRSVLPNRHVFLADPVYKKATYPGQTKFFNCCGGIMQRIQSKTMWPDRHNNPLLTT